MQPSEIIVPPSEESAPSAKAQPVPIEQRVDSKRAKLGQAYIRERQKQELTDIELHRSKVIVMDENGRILRMSLTTEH